MRKIDWFEVFEWIKILASVVILAATLYGLVFLIFSSGYEDGKKSVDRVVVYQVDNAGTEMHGKITDKQIIDGRYTVTAGAYGKFLVSKEQYDEIKVGDEIPDYLKGRGN